MKNNTSPLITIVTVSLNAGKLLERTIESVCSQDYDNIEYIIIDGNSTDNSLSIIKKYSNYISKFISEPDKGVYDAMNKGVKLASSKSLYITFINAGDVFHSSNIIRNIILFTTVTQPHIYGNYTKSGEITVQTPEKLNQFFLSNRMVCHQAFFFRTEVHKKYLYDTKYRICADYKLLIDLLRNGE